MLSDANKASKRGRKPKESTDIDRYNAPFARNLRDLFEKSGETQDSVAAALNTSRQTFGNWLNGRFQPDFDSLARIAKYYNVSVDYLLGLTKDQSVKPDIRIACKTTGLHEDAIKMLIAYQEPLLETEKEKKTARLHLEIISRFLSSGRFAEFCKAFELACTADTLTGTLEGTIQFHGIADSHDQVESLRLWLIHEQLKRIAEKIVFDMCGGADNGKHQ